MNNLKEYWLFSSSKILFLKELTFRALRLRNLLIHTFTLLMLLQFASFESFSLSINSNLNKVLQNESELSMHEVREMPLLYFENKGQVTDVNGDLLTDVKFVVNQPAMKILVRETGISYIFQRVKSKSEEHNPVFLNERKEQGGTFDYKNYEYEAHRIDLNFEGSSYPSEIVKAKVAPYAENYYLSHCSEGITVKGYEQVTFKNTYPGIDLILYTKEGKLKYDWLIHKGADPNQIQMEIVGANKCEIDQDGNLNLFSPMGTIKETAPIIIQSDKSLDGKFVKKGGRITFSLPEYDKNQELLIDPFREWSTFFGGSQNDVAYNKCIATDNDNNIFILGGTTSMNLPVGPGAFQGFLAGTGDVFVAKFNPNGELVWTTYYGGNLSERGEGIAVGMAGNIFVQGYTRSIDFPTTTDSFQPSYSGGEQDAFFIKFNNDGQRVWATFYGGSETDYGIGGVALDTVGNIYFHGQTSSQDFPVTDNAFQNELAHHSSFDAYLVKFDPDGDRLWATFVGGDRDDRAQSCVSDSNGNVFISGSTLSSFFPVSESAFQSQNFAFESGYLAKFNPSGERIWATLFGGTDLEDTQIMSSATDDSGHVFIHGRTKSLELPVTEGAYQSEKTPPSNLDAFLAKFDSDGNLSWATYFGGEGNDGGYNCTVDSLGDVFITGFTESSQFPVTPNALQSENNGEADGYISKFSSRGDLLYSTYYGGSSDDYVYAGCALDNTGNLVVFGVTDSQDFPVTENAFQEEYGGGSNDVFLLKLNLSFDSDEDGIADISDPCPFNESAFIDGCGNCVGGDTGEEPCTILVSGLIFWSLFTERPAIIKFYDSETSELIEESEILLNGSGDFVTWISSPGEYDIFLKVEGHLQTALYNVSIYEDVYFLNFGNIIFGDIINNNKIDIQDYALFSVTYGLNYLQDGFIYKADSDDSGEIDIQDFALFSVNYGLEGLSPE